MAIRAVFYSVTWPPAAGQSGPRPAARRHRRGAGDGDLGGHHAVGLRVDVAEVVGRRQRRWPQAYQLLQLIDGVSEEGGVWGLGEKHGPDPGRVGRSSVGWLHQRAQQGFVPTEAVIHLSGSTITWRLD